MIVERNIRPERPSAHWTGRIWAYLERMYPLHVRLPVNLLNFAFIYFGLQALLNEGPLSLTRNTLIGALTVQLLWLFIRVYDEFKDFEFDLAMARAGDPRFTKRPLVTGAVRLSDIALLRWAMTGGIVSLNLFNPWLAAGLAISFGYITLSYKWFFVPRLRDNPILVFITHIPNVLVTEIYTAFAVFADGSAASFSGTQAGLIASLWLVIAAFEFSYKIRAPLSETAFDSYSKVLGYRRATGCCIVLLLASAVALCWVASALSLGSLTIGIIAASGAWALLGCIRFVVFRPGGEAPLTKYVGLHWIASSAAFVASLIFSRGLVFPG